MVWRRYSRNKRQALEEEDLADDEDLDEDDEDEEVLSRDKRNGDARNRKSKNTRRPKNKFSSLDDDFNFGTNVYQVSLFPLHRLFQKARPF